MTQAPIFLLWLLTASADGQRADARPCLWCAPVAAPLRQPLDAWFAEDKMRHLAMAFAATTFAHAAGRAAGMDAGSATAAGAAAAVAASVGKEIFDRRAGGIFSVRDLVWDAVGIALGVLMVGNAR